MNCVTNKDINLSDIHNNYQQTHKNIFKKILKFFNTQIINRLFHINTLMTQTIESVYFCVMHDNSKITQLLVMLVKPIYYFVLSSSYIILSFQELPPVFEIFTH